ncbi:hypothetical protein F7Q99_13125 [Streptomyces kaniharaensis]|uniref:Zinc-finger domain-containing protein n=1 Tax=Streptomyces kaniharaensis TaxID=212423 RepID=A0A6N7KS75_9ACTN|nr:zf-HC2 domain-containing protein [Streptomyces kaniharaensis]MQS13198.1 hypothetical protein [Streptomyces kaniharaensis]
MTAPFSSPGSPDSPESHPPTDQLADLAEGLIDDADAAEALHRHLAGCAECRETADALREVQALLGEVETPPMPADVAARLDAALADEQASRAEARREAADRPQEAPGRTAGAPTPAAPSRPATTPAAPPARPVGATGPGRSRSRRRRFGLLLGAAAALAAIGLGGALLYPTDSGSTGASVSAGAPTATDAGHSITAEHALGAGTAYRDDQLAAQIQQLLARSGGTAEATAGGPGKPSAAPAEGQQGLTAQTAPQTAPRTCPAPAEGTLLATDHGSYTGAPVDVLVYAVPGKPGVVDVYLRSPDCGPVLLHRTVLAH